MLLSVVRPSARGTSQRSVAIRTMRRIEREKSRAEGEKGRKGEREKERFLI
jgi:hypothetical protein